jgi:hypothetical protein
MSEVPTIPLRFQRAELEEKASLTPEGRTRLAETAHPARLVETLHADGNHRDAAYALAMLLPHRQTVWWACLAARLVPDLEARRADLAGVVAAERWVQSQIPDDAELAGEVAESCSSDFGPYWVAMAACWSGPSMAPRGQQPVPPPPHLPGTATRIALLSLLDEPAFAGVIGMADLLDLGMALMRGESGAEAQTALRRKLGR